MSDVFQSAKRAAHGIEGMLSDFSIATMDAMLSFQEESGVLGHLVEFGVFKGRCAAILASHTKPKERLILVDVAEYIERSKIEAICPHTEIIISSSERFKSTFRDYKAVTGSCRFVHVDSSHQYRATLLELALSEALLQDRGVIVLDDFTNLNYSQILAATYKYVYTTRTKLCLFLVTAEKAYLCKRKDFDFFGKFVLERIVDEMARREMPDTCIARTDSDPEYRAFHLRPHLPGEDGRYYGLSLYKSLYQKP